MNILNLFIFMKTYAQVLKNVVNYTRVSSQKQASSQSYSLASQRSDCQKYALQHNYNIVETVEDVGSAFTNGKQPNLEKVITKLLTKNDNNVSKIIVTSHDRFSRHAEFAKSLINKLKKKNIILETVNNNIVYNTKQGMDKLNNIFNAAQYQSELASTKIKSALDYKRSQGLVSNSQVTYGCKNNNGKLEIDAEEQIIIKFIFCARFGLCTSQELSEIIYQILPKNMHIPIEYVEINNTCEKIIPRLKSKALTYNEIADLLYDYDVKKRQKEWNANSVGSICKTNINLLEQYTNEYNKSNKSCKRKFESENESENNDKKIKLC